jgi:hypothetical protein
MQKFIDQNSANEKIYRFMQIAEFGGSVNWERLEKLCQQAQTTQPQTYEDENASN